MCKSCKIDLNFLPPIILVIEGTTYSLFLWKQWNIAGDFTRPINKLTHNISFNSTSVTSVHFLANDFNFVSSIETELCIQVFLTYHMTTHSIIKENRLFLTFIFRPVFLLKSNFSMSPSISIYSSDASSSNSCTDLHYFTIRYVTIFSIIWRTVLLIFTLHTSSDI